MGPYPFFCANKLFYNKLYMCIFTNTDQFTLISPKGFMNKNLGYPGLLGQVIT